VPSRQACTTVSPVAARPTASTLDRPAWAAPVINDIGLHIAQGLLGQAQIGTGQIFKTCAHFRIGFGFSLGEKLCRPEQGSCPRGQGPLCLFYAMFLCNAARVKSFPETTETSLYFFTSARKSYPPKEHIANREQIVYIADFGRIRRCSGAALSGGRIPAIRSATS
jgi:hypothetical protein